MAYKNLNVANLTVSDTSNKSKYVVTQVGTPKKFNLPKDKHAPEYQYINTDGVKMDYTCLATLEDKPN